MEKNNNIMKLIALLILGFAFSSASNAQTIEKKAFVKKAFVNIDWQLNQPLGSSFANKFSGWGANIDGGYNINSKWGVGLFVSYHTNREYINRQTINTGETSALTTDQQHSLFQIPFGVSGRYSLGTPGSRFQPYAGLKLGTNYSKMSSHMNIFKMSDDAWGFHVSPEIGTNIYLDPESKYGLHFAAYYSYSTNNSSLLTYSISGINNVGIRLGVAF